MARCDGRWHPLETEMIESFASSLWIQSEWEGDPDIAEIVVHAQRISPDADSFFAALRRYSQDPLLTRLICRAAGNPILAAGVTCPAEMHWGADKEERKSDM